MIPIPVPNHRLAFSGNVHIWNLSSEWHQNVWQEKEANIQCVDIDPAGNMIAAITNKGTFVTAKFGRNASEEDWSLKGMFKPNNSTKINKVTAHKKYGLKCKFSPDSKILATTSADQTAKLWNTSDQDFISVSIFYSVKRNAKSTEENCP